jgi:pimeloyl-ACP methyl ester carboxylesterase
MSRFVLVHGAFAGAWCWEPLIPALEAAGHEVRAFDLPGSGEDRTPPEEVTLDRYAERICEVLAEGDEPAVLVGHSMGGMAITQAAGRCPERIAALAYVCAFLPGEGKSLQDMAGLPEGADDQIQANMVVEPPYAKLSPEGARAAVYGVTDEEQTTWALAHYRDQLIAPFGGAASRGDGFDAIPKTYVVCTQDNSIPLALQRRMLREAGVTDVHELDSDHSPFLCRTAELAEILNGIAG